MAPKHPVILKPRKQTSGNLFNREVLTRIYVKESRCTVLRVREDNDLFLEVHYGPLPAFDPAPFRFAGRLHTLMQMFVKFKSKSETLFERPAAASGARLTEAAAASGARQPAAQGSQRRWLVQSDTVTVTVPVSNMITDAACSAASVD